MAKEKQDRRGENNPMYGRHHKQESKEKMSQSASKRHSLIKGLLAENNAIAFIIQKGLYEEYTSWVYKKIAEK